MRFLIYYENFMLKRNGIFEKSENYSNVIPFDMRALMNICEIF